MKFSQLLCPRQSLPNQPHLTPACLSLTTTPTPTLPARGSVILQRLEASLAVNLSLLPAPGDGHIFGTTAGQAFPPSISGPRERPQNK